ncbi:hypothetical protein [Stutzerimonas nitrititolerans]|uniref:hypothetical protein n=1 Tax=Stutzerimonas nitrititolerans TaxID=2482751 RepID=UPI0028A7A0DD|nr:hypothetical protein [Stutzerimonas nitrititolerans]
MKYSNNVVATFAKNMLCPPSLQNGAGSDIASQGLSDFQAYRYRHSSVFYHGDSSCLEEELMDNIQASLKVSLMKGEKTPLLLLSDGKDSMSLAVAFSELNVCCDTLTFLRNADDQLKSYIESVALRLGHKPYFVTVDEILKSYDSETFLKACGEMDTPVLDQAFFFFLFGIKSFFHKQANKPNNYVIFDGLGNDEYLGYLPSRNQLASYKISRFGAWKLIPNIAKSLRWYVRSPSESHGDLSALACFFELPESLDLNKYFSRIPHSSKALDFIDFRAFSRGSFHDHQCMMGKTIAAAKCFRSSVVFPWLYKPLADYCFNLPVEQKFDFEKLKNKIPLRMMLRNKIGWNQEKRGVDLYFDLDMDFFRRRVICEFVPEHIVSKIDSNLFLPRYVKKRAYLELLNFYGYCKAHGYDNRDIEKILMG